MTADYPLTGPEAIEHALSRIDLDELEAEQRQVITSKKKTARPRAVRLLGIIAGLRKNQVGAGELMLKSVPVIPPKFRPFSVTGDTFLPGDANEMYRDLLEYRRLYQKTEESLGREGSGEVYGDLMKAVRATYGFGDSPNPKTHARGVKGFFQTVTGTSPKTGFFQSKMLSKPVDTVARGVIIPDAEYDMNEIGLPAEHAWKLYGSYIQRRLVRSGLAPAAALRHVKERTPQALKALESEMTARPVVATRSPAWHKFNVVGANPRIVEGDAIRINTWITDGLTADFDGDDHNNQVVTAIESNLPLNKSWTDLGVWPSSNPMLAKLNLPMLDASKRVVIADLADFPRTVLRYSKEGNAGPIHFYDVPPGTMVVAFDESTSLPVWADVSTYSVHPQRVVEIVNLTNRRQIFTDDDPRAVYGVAPGDPAMRLQRFAPTAALAARVCVPVVRHTDALVGDVTAVNVGATAVDLDADFGFLLGAWCGDGWWDKRDHSYYRERNMFDDTRALQLSDLNGSVAAVCVRILREKLVTGQLYTFRQEHFKKTDDSRYGDTVKYTFGYAGSTAFAVWLDEHLGGARCDKSSGSANKHLPGFAYTAPRDFREGLLAGLIDTDGTCAVSNGKGKPQLMIAFSSTSLRLARECQALCRTLGISSAVSFSKETSGGNTSWMVTISTVDAKREGFLGRLLQNDHKRANFNNTVVSVGKGSEMRDAVILPEVIGAHLIRWLEAPKLAPADRQSDSPELILAKHQQSLYTRTHRAAKAGIIPRALLSAVEAELHRSRGAAGADLAEGLRALRQSLVDGKFDKGRSDKVRDAARAVSPKQAATFNEGCKVVARVNTPLRNGVMSERTARGLIEWLESAPPREDPLKLPAYVQWRQRFVDTDTEWATVESVEYTGQREDGYDLTVPGYETFMAVDGVILSNTMSVHLPSTDAAIKDVRERMMPDKMLWSVKDRDSVVPKPKHEQQIGLNLGGSQAIKNRRTFVNEADAMRAIESGQVDLNDDIDINPSYVPAAPSFTPGSIDR